GLSATATAAQVEDALNALSTVGGVGGSVTVTLSAGVYTITFGAAFTGVNEPQITAQGNGGTIAVASTAFDGGSGQTVNAEALTISGAGFNAAGALENVAGANTWTGTVTLATNPAALPGTDAIGVDPNAQLTITGNVQDASATSGRAANLTKVGTGTLVFPN